MARSTDEWIGKQTTRKSLIASGCASLTARRICHLTDAKIDPVRELGHKISLILGGEHRESNLFPVLREPSDGFHTWTVEQVEKYRNHHKLGTKPRLAIDILLFLGLRRSDAVVVGRQHLKDGVISLRTGKTGAWVYLPVFKQLLESIEATPTGDMAFLTTQTGKPFSSGASFGNWFAKQCKLAACLMSAERTGCERQAPR